MQRITPSAPKESHIRGGGGGGHEFEFFFISSSTWVKIEYGLKALHFPSFHFYPHFIVVFFSCLSQPTQLDNLFILTLIPHQQQ